MKRILIQLDTDPLPSTFDRVVAVDADVDELFSYGGVTPENVVPLVHGAMFTRGPADLKNTAIFIGGSDVAAGEALLRQVTKTFFGPVSVSVMLDSNGSNTTAAAAVLAAGRHLELSTAQCVVLGATGPVGLRAAQLLAATGAQVCVVSRSQSRADAVVKEIAADIPDAKLSADHMSGLSEAASVIAGAALVISAGAAGVQLVSEETWRSSPTLKVAIDLNAVPPAGIEGIGVTDKAATYGDVVCYGAIGVGGTKMKIHKAAINRLFQANDLQLDTAAIYEIGRAIG